MKFKNCQFSDLMKVSKTMLDYDLFYELFIYLENLELFVSA